MFFLSTFFSPSALNMTVHDEETQDLLQNNDAESPSFITRETASSVIFRSPFYLWILVASVSGNILLALVSVRLAIKANYHDPSLLLYCKLAHYDRDKTC